MRNTSVPLSSISDADLGDVNGRLRVSHNDAFLNFGGVEVEETNGCREGADTSPLRIVFELALLRMAVERTLGLDLFPP